MREVSTDKTIKSGGEYGKLERMLYLKDNLTF